MHHAHRVSRTGIRTAASAARPAGDIGKWALPSSPSLSQNAPTSFNKWAPLRDSPDSTRTNRMKTNPTRHDPPRTRRDPSSRVSADRLNKWQVSRPSPPQQRSQPDQAPSAPFNSRLAERIKERASRGPVVHVFPDNQGTSLDVLQVEEPHEAKDGRHRPKFDNRRARGDPYKERGSVLAQGHTRNFDRKSERDQPSNGMQKNKPPKPKQHKKISPDIFIPSIVSVGNLAKLLGVRLDRLQRKMVQAGMKDETSYDHILTAEYASLIAMEFGRNPVVNDEAAFDLFAPPEPADRSSLPVRPPIVTIMGHVDHGKTTLLDTLRSASVAAGEAGGITQHIGAFSVDVPSHDPSSSASHRKITFLDTPGHAAFSSMRSRGASVTDVVVLVVAADDGIMPQTREVLELVKKEGDNVALIVAINKVDKPGVDPEEVEKALLAEGVQLDSFGGDIPVVRVSGLTGQGLSDLVETISLVAEMRDLRAEASGPVQGYVLESRVEKGLGPTATVMIVRGSLTAGTHLVCGTTVCKVRRLIAPSGDAVESVGPGMAATVIGWKEVPSAGDEVLSGTESDIKRAVANRIRKAAIEATLGDVDSINENRRAEREAREAEDGGVQVHQTVEAKKELRLIIKADVSGTAEAVAGCLQGIGNHLACVKIVAADVGPVTESDVMRAKASEATIIAFSVDAPRSVRTAASGQKVPILESNIIYRLMDDVKEKVVALLPPVIERKVTGEATVLQIFEIQLKAKQTKKVAGCRVTSGILDKNKKARVVRDNEIVFEGTIETLRNHKANITEATKGLECGMAFENWEDLREGDTIQVFQDIEKPRSL